MARTVLFHDTLARWCFVKMRGWIEQAKKKLFAIIKETRKDIDNLELRVAYIGYVFFRPFV